MFTYMVDMALTRISRVENLYVIARMNVVWVTGQPERPVRVETAVFRVETADARLNRDNTTCARREILFRQLGTSISVKQVITNTCFR